MGAALTLVVIAGFFAALSLSYADRRFGHAPGKEETLAAHGFTWDDLTTLPSAPEPRLARRVVRTLSVATRIVVGAAATSR